MTFSTTFIPTWQNKKHIWYRNNHVSSSKLLTTTINTHVLLYYKNASPPKEVALFHLIPSLNLTHVSLIDFPRMRG